VSAGPCRELRFEAGGGEVSALLDRPRNAKAVCVLAHGAGAGMRHPFMEGVVARLAGRAIASFRFQFPYMERGRRAPDRPAVLVETVRSAVAAARKATRGLALLAGGKSMGGRMTSIAEAEDPLGVLGLVFLGYPLHPAGRPGNARAHHLPGIHVPALYVQGTRDPLADLDLLAPIVRKLVGAQMHVVGGGDHSFRVLKRSGRTNEEALDEVADAVATFVEQLVS
jgi:uncharacterized protein